MGPGARRVTALRSPKPDMMLDEFPVKQRVEPMWRIILARHPHTGEPRAPFWFASTGADPYAGGRYGLPPPHGSCYFATSPQGAWLEVFRTTMVALGDLRKRRLCVTTPPRSVTLGNLTTKRVRGFGITGDIHTCDDYTIPQQWSAALHTHGLQGISGKVRHDPALEEGTTTLFSNAGTEPPYGWEWDVTSTGLADDVDLIISMSRWGIRTAEVPHDVPTIA